MLLTFVQDRSFRYLPSTDDLYQAVDGYSLADIYDEIELLEASRRYVSLGVSTLDAGRQAWRGRGSPDLTVRLRDLVTCLVRQCVGEFDVVGVVRDFEPKQICDINRPCRAWLILQASQVGLDISTVHLQFRLVRKCNILNTSIIAGTEHHDSHGTVCCTLGELWVIMGPNLDIDTVPVVLHDWASCQFADVVAASPGEGVAGTFTRMDTPYPT